METRKPTKEEYEFMEEKLRALPRHILVFLLQSKAVEKSLEDIFATEEPELFESITGISPAQLQLLDAGGLFNREILDPLIRKTTRFKEAKP